MPRGLYTNSLIGPGVWPPESEQDLRNTGASLQNVARELESATTSARALTTDVFSLYWTAGSGSMAAEEHYRAEDACCLSLAEAYRFIGRAYGRLADNVGSVKRHMRDAHDNAHHEIERVLRSNVGQPVNVTAITAVYRSMISDYSAELHVIVADEVSMLSQEFVSETPPEGGDEREGMGDDLPTDGSSTTEASVTGSAGGRIDDLPTASESMNEGRNDGLGDSLPSPAVVTARPATERPEVPQVPSMGGNGGGSPLSGAASGGMGQLSGLMGSSSPASGARSVAGSAAGNPAAVQSQTAARAMSSGLGGEFGRSFAASATAAAVGAPMVPQQPMPQTPSTPLAATWAATTRCRRLLPRRARRRICPLRLRALRWVVYPPVEQAVRLVVR